MSVHSRHCCVEHGCKYGEEDCPVVIGIEEPIIHSHNKQEIEIKKLPIYQELIKRKNVILLMELLKWDT